MATFTNDQTDNNANQYLVNNSQQMLEQLFPGPPIGGLTRSVNLPYNVFGSDYEERSEEERSEDGSRGEKQNLPLPLSNFSAHN